MSAKPERIMAKMMRIGVLVCCVLALTSCDPYVTLANNALGVSLSPDGQRVEIQFLLCPGKMTTAVELVINSRNGGVIGDDADPVLWKITAQAGSLVEDVTAGETPPGFVEVVPLRTEIPASGPPLGVLVDSTQGQAVVEFHLADLRSDRVFSRLKSLSPAEFQAQAAKACH